MPLLLTSPRQPEPCIAITCWIISLAWCRRGQTLLHSTTVEVRLRLGVHGLLHTLRSLNWFLPPIQNRERSAKVTTTQATSKARPTHGESSPLSLTMRSIEPFKNLS